MSKNKHLTTKEHFQIEAMLRQQYSFKEIAQTIGKNLFTISCEVRKHAQKSEKFAPHYPANRCLTKLFHYITFDVVVASSYEI